MATELTQKDFRALQGAEFAAAVMDRVKANDEYLRSSKTHEINQYAWSAYYQRDKLGGGACLLFKGPRGEVISLTPALYRAPIQNQMAQRSQLPLEPEPIAVNRDPESQAQCRDVAGILRYYLGFTNLGELLLERFEMRAVLSESALHVRWDGSAGDKIERAGVEPNTVVQIPEGDFVFSVRSRYDYWFDTYSPDMRRPTCWIVREPVNRFDAIARWGKDDETRLALDRAPAYHTVTEQWMFDKRSAQNTQLDDAIPVYYVYCEKAAGCPDGRAAIVLDADTVLEDGPMLEQRAGVFPLVSSRVMFRPDGHSNHIGGLVIAEARGAELSIAATNRAATGIPKMQAPRAANLKVRDMAGLKLAEYDHVDADGQPLQGASLINGVDVVDLELETKLAELQDTIQQDSPVQRGQANASDSGAKVAALLSATQQVSAPDMLADLRSIGHVFTYMLQVFKRNASEDRTLRIVGQDKRYTVKKYKADSLASVESVVMRAPKAERDTFQGRMAFAELLNGAKNERELQMLIALYNTGNVDVATGDVEDDRIAIERENEALRDPNVSMQEAIGSIDGKPGKNENHRKHYESHKKERNSDSVKRDPVVAARFDEHMAATIARLTPFHPDYAGDDVLSMTGQQPLSPPQTPPGQGANAEKQQSGGKAPPQPNGKPAPEGEQDDGGSKPGQAGLPKNPATGERMEGAPPPPPAGVA